MHRICPDLLRRTVQVLVVGCGGSGCVIASGLPYLHQVMIVAGYPGGLAVTVMDGDIISAANTVRQPFCTSEIGLNKAIVVVSRLNLFWELDWKAVPEHLHGKSDLSSFDIVIGSVDTRHARRLIQDKIQGQRSRVAYWLDLGNHASGGQFVLGQPLNSRNRRSANRLRTAGELFQELVDTSIGDDDEPSCSALEAIERQEPFVNQVLANHALALLARLFRYGEIDHHGAFVSVAGSRVVPIPINPSLWRKMRRHGARTSTHLPPTTADLQM